MGLGESLLTHGAIISQNSLTLGHVHHRWSNVPFCPHPLQQQASDVGYICASLTGVQYHLAKNLYDLSCT